MKMQKVLGATLIQEHFPLLERTMLPHKYLSIRAAELTIWALKRVFSPLKVKDSDNIPYLAQL